MNFSKLDTSRILKPNSLSKVLLNDDFNDDQRSDTNLKFFTDDPSFGDAFFFGSSLFLHIPPLPILQTDNKFLINLIFELLCFSNLI